jgi:putative PIG3 family NAD(P)H quinone oxidoreductase
MTIPKQMTAIAIKEPGDAHVLAPVELATPQPGPGEVLIKVEAAGVNRADTLQRRGFYPPPKGAPDTPGLEVAGRIAAVGPECTRFKPGEAVCALVNGGGYASYCLARENHCLPIPEGLDMVEAGSLPEAYFTVWASVFERGHFAEGESLLVHGGSSGIGTTAIQMASSFYGARVFATARTEQKCKICLELGAEQAINYLEQDFVEIISKATAGRGVDVILDMVGGDYIDRNIACAAVDGRIVNIAYLNGPRAEVDFMPVMLKRLTLTAATLRARSDEDKAGIARHIEQKFWPLVEAGTIRPVIDSHFPLSQASRAHELMESSRHIGKIMLTV